MTRQLQPGVNLDFTNAEYHGDKNYLSSSTLKDIRKSRSKFYKKHILKDEFKSLGSDAMDLGSYLHSLILEPDKTDAEFAIFDGTRRGGEYLAFKDAAKGKIILNGTQFKTAQTTLADVNNSKKCKTLLSEGSPEFTYTTILYDVPVKVRADWLNLNSNYILDVKTTSADLNKDSLMKVISNLEYDLSAALYVDAFKKLLGIEPNFYFLFASTKGAGVKVYRASSKLIENGQKKYKNAINIYKTCMETGCWDDPVVAVIPEPPETDEIEDIDPAPWGMLQDESIF